MIRHTSSDTYTPTGGTPWCSGTVNTKWIPRKPKISAYCKETLRKLAISENFTFYLHMLSICIGRTSWCAPSALQFCSLEQDSYIWAESSVWGICAMSYLLMMQWWCAESNLCICVSKSCATRETLVHGYITWLLTQSVCTGSFPETFPCMHWSQNI